MATKRMTTKVFMTKLRKLRGEFAVLPNGLIRTIKKYRREGGYTPSVLCPIERVSAFLGGPVDDSALTLHPKTRAMIMNGADDGGVEGRRCTVRRQMLKALALKEIG